MSSNDFGWCFIGSGGIANKVMGDMPFSDGGYLAAVYSRTYENACKLANKHDAKPYKTILEAFNDPNVKAVYIASPHTSHKEHTLHAIECGLPVLCEKPIAVTYQDAVEMFKIAGEKKIYLLDGLWTRFNPVVCQALDMINEGAIGQVRSLTASFCIYKDFNPNARHFDPELGGGSLLDIGIYPILYACMVFDEMPEEISVIADYAPNGVEHLLSIVLRYRCGAIARLFSGFSTNEPQDACISGTDGYIHIPFLWKAKTASLHFLDSAKDDILIDPGFPGFGYQYIFNAAMDDIRASRTENALLTHDLSLKVMSIIEKVRELM
ncbi:MAG: Gfo/Idh/MocA family oxidoreductase [Oscillospiraceae bacterium]|jgi:predicted dehydrogenase|nr:Gfo/Idh/MocA family oxidoreductase [Oscillospiraceae bacterium]